MSEAVDCLSFASSLQHLQVFLRREAMVLDLACIQDGLLFLGYSANWMSS